MLIFALTGSIGMGKSTTAAMFAAQGVPVHDSDACVHRLYAGAAAPLIEQRFPGVLKNGCVDRKELGHRVLNDASAMAELEAIIHPLVASARDAFLRNCIRAGFRRVLLDIPLYFESSARQDAHCIVVASANELAQRQRVMARNGMTEDKFRQILARQIPDSEKRKRAHWIIFTDRGVEAAARQVADLLRSIARD